MVLHIVQASQGVTSRFFSTALKSVFLAFDAPKSGTPLYDIPRAKSPRYIAI